MPLEELIFGFIAGATGSILVWLLVAPRLIVRFGQKALEAWIDSNIPDDPTSEAAAHKPLDPRLKKVLAVMTYHVGATISGVFGDMSKKIGEELQAKGPEMVKGMIGGADPSQLLAKFTGGGNGKRSPWGGLAEMFSMFQMFGQMMNSFGGHPGGAAGGSTAGALPPNPFIGR